MLVMLDVVLVLGTPTYPPRNVIVVLMMVLFSYQSSLSLISLQLRRKSQLTLLDDIKLTINSTFSITRSYQPVHQDSVFGHLSVIKQNPCGLILE